LSAHCRDSCQAASPSTLYGRDLVNVVDLEEGELGRSLGRNSLSG